MDREREVEKREIKQKDAMHVLAAGTQPRGNS